jgi:hypothetical protein
MFDCLVDGGELTTSCEPYDRASVPQRTEGIRQDEFSNWGNYALFVFEQQESYCQLV